MKCTECQNECAKFGKNRNGSQRFRCLTCKKTYSEAPQGRIEGFNLPIEKMAMIVTLLVEGASVRSVERITGTHRDTILKVLVAAGEKCAKIMGRVVRDLEVADVECDEIWSFIGKKQKRVTTEDSEDMGDQYCFVAIERNTKLVINFAFGKRDQRTTNAFIEGLRDAVRPGCKFQITTDGFSPYVSAIKYTLGHVVDFAQLIKVYANLQDGEKRYSPAEVSSVEVVPVIGQPDPKRICTSIVERSNLSMRMGMRRYTRLTNAFSKKWENHWAMLCLYFVHYNFVRVHRSLRVTPAMEARLTNRIWTVKEILSTQD
jgi:transposase-like protein/IS1 family transposase